MHKFILVVFVLTNFISFGQGDSLITDRTIEGVHKKSMCDVDTLVTVYSKKIMVIEDSTDLSYEFKNGDKSYIEIRLRSTICSCKDCSFADHLSIDVTNLKPGDKVTLTNSNTTWIHWNSLMMVDMEEYFSGTLIYNGGEKFTIEVFKILPAQPQVRYDGIRVVNS